MQSHTASKAANSAVHHGQQMRNADQRRARNAQPIDAASNPDALLKIQTIEALTGLSRSSIYAKAAKGEFPAMIKLGKRCTRVRAGDVTDWLKAQVHGA